MGLSLGLVSAYFFSWTFLLIFSFALLALFKLSFKPFLKEIVFFCLAAFSYKIQLVYFEKNQNLVEKAKFIEGEICQVESGRIGFYKNKVDLLIQKADEFNFLFRPKVSVFFRHQKLFVGQKIKIYNFNLSLFNQGFLRHGVLGSIFIKNFDEQIVFCSNPKPSLFVRLSKFKSRVYNFILSKLNFKAKSLFSLIFMGVKDQKYSIFLRDKFSNWGISHYLARSGLHVTLFCVLWLSIFSLFFFDFRLRILATLTMALFYFFLTWPSVSFLRAELMFFLFAVAKILMKQACSLHLLFITFILILLLNPFQFFALDFQLSFSLVFGLILASWHWSDLKEGKLLNLLKH